MFCDKYFAGKSFGQKPMAPSINLTGINRSRGLRLESGDARSKKTILDKYHNNSKQINGF